MLQPSEVAAFGRPIEEVLDGLLEAARGRARAPVSNYRVGAVALGESGRVYLGFNVELPGLDLSQTVHAEQSLVALALAHEETCLTALAVTAPPCGHCRQFLQELQGGQELQIHILGRPTMTLEQLLPDCFSPQDLGVKTYLFRHPDFDIAYDSQDRAVLCALKAARRSYAPYSHCAAGVCLSTDDGQIWGGSYVENAAFNPSLSPLQAALVHMLGADRRPEQIERAVLVHRPTLVDLESSTRAALNSLSPQLELQIVRIR